MQCSKIDLNPRVIDEYLRYLLLLKEHNGRCNQDELWTGDIIQRLNDLRHWSDDMPLVHAAREKLHVLEDIKDAVGHLLNSLQTTVTTLKTTLFPFQRGKELESLPDDILSLIFVYVGSRRTLVPVCRRFRRVATSIPQLWSYITNYSRGMQHVHTSLRESKAVGLDIELNLDAIGPILGFQLDPLLVLDATLAHVNRWEKLSIMSKYDDPWQKTEICIAELGKRLKNTQIPRLRSLILEYPDITGDDDDDALDGPDSGVHFYKSWSLPKLQDFVVKNVVPIPFSTPALTSLTILLRSRGREGHSLLPLLAFLSSVPCLEKLHLSLEHLRLEANLPTTTLLHLKSLRMDILPWLATEFRFLTKALIIPTIRSMHFRILPHDKLEDAWDLSQALDDFLSHDEYPTLEELTFEYRETDLSQDSDTYDIPFTRVPNLQKLTLTTHGWHPRFSWKALNYGRIPPLRSLRLNGGKVSEWAAWLEIVHNKMKEESKLLNFQDLSINTVDHLNKDRVENLFRDQKVTWGEAPLVHC